MNEKEKLYNFLKEQGMVSASFEDFDKGFSSPEKIGQLYSLLKDRELVSMPEDSFRSTFFSVSSENSHKTEPNSPDLPISDTSVPQNEIAPQEPNMEATGGNAFYHTLSRSGWKGIAEQAGEAINSIFRSGLHGIGQGVESLGTLSDQLRSRAGEDSALSASIQLGDSEKSILTNAGQQIQSLAQELFPNDPNIQDTFINNTVPQALGSTIGYLAASRLGGGSLSAIFGAFQMGQQAFTEAKAAGADDDTAMSAFLWNMPLGAIEAIPVTKTLSRFNKATGGAFAQVLKEGAIGGIEEAVQETIQQWGSNIVAGNLYDESRRLMDGVASGGGAGFVVGFMLNAMGAKVRDLRQTDLTTEEMSQIDKTMELIKRKKQQLEDTPSPEKINEAEQETVEKFQETVSVEDDVQKSDSFTEREQLTLDEQAQYVADKYGGITHLRYGYADIFKQYVLNPDIASADLELFLMRGAMDEEAGIKDNYGMSDPAIQEQLYNELDAAFKKEAADFKEGNPEKIVSAVIEVNNGEFVEGNSHSDAYNKAIEQGLIKNDSDLVTGDYFKTNWGRIINRMEARDRFNGIESSEKAGIKPPVGDNNTTDNGDGNNRLPESDMSNDQGTGRERGAFTTQKNKGDLSEDFKKEFQKKGERLYDPVPDDVTKTIADDYVEKVGLRSAMNKVFDPNASLTMAQRIAIGHKILSNLDGEYQAAKKTDREKAQIILDEQIDFANQVYKFGTELGRAVRAFSYYSAFSSDTFIRMYERAIEESGVEVSSEQRSKDRTRIKEIVDNALKQPEGFQRDEAILDAMNEIHKRTPPSNTDIGISIAYANLLSGHETQVVNFTSTALNTILETGTMAMANPRVGVDAFIGLYRGWFKGWAEAKNIVKTGKVTGTRRSEKLADIPVALERVQFKGGKLNPFNYYKYVTRIMQANDVIFFKAAEESRARMLAKSMALKEGGTEAEIRARVEQIMGTTGAQVKAAEKQALSEGLERGSNNFKRRVYEIAEQQRSKEMMAEATEYGLRATFNNTPDGVLGIAAQSINSFTSRVPLGKAVVPFTNVVANVTNRMLDYTPVGYFRLHQWSKNSTNPEFNSEAWRQQAAKAALGTVGMMTVAAMNMMNMDDDNPDFMITGRGPDDYQHRYQLQESGWKPYSVKIGDTYYSYRETPLGLAFGLIANYTDAIKYGNISQESALERVKYALNAAPQTVMSQSFLTGLQDFFTSLSEERIITGDDPFAKLFKKVSAFAIPNAVKQIDRIFDPRVMTDDDIQEALIRDVPVVRSTSGSPIINVLGEPIRKDYTLSERALKRFIGKEQSDPVWRTIVDKQAWISYPSRNTKITDRTGQRRTMTNDEFYNYVLISGRDLHRSLRMNLPKIKNMPDDQAAEFIRQLTNDHRSAARKRIEQTLLGADKKTP